ncbi:hypothetical protein JHD48_04295 [Sulfurimonas sp. SAG-AH-194-I05]|nr:hypothetical protein [Sulfurimonas sp. SAG-AH-194-I05]MDF1874949.1 hypothetical protein [Sulfurimonas sp. SAG-AH-194-I05]
MRSAFSFLELVIVITLSGIMAILSFSYLNISTLAKQNTKTQFQSHISILSAMILQCKELSNSMPVQSDDSLANDTLLSTLDCNTTVRYTLDGGRGSFVPKPLIGFSEYKATQTGSEFYFSTIVDRNSNNNTVLESLEDDFSSNQYILTQDATTTLMKFYLSR